MDRSLVDRPIKAEGPFVGLMYFPQAQKLEIYTMDFCRKTGTFMRGHQVTLVQEDLQALAKDPQARKILRRIYYDLKERR